MSRGSDRRITRRVRSNGRILTYLLRLSDARRLSISVDPDLSVSVVAPGHATVEAVDARVLKRAAWIFRQQRHFERYHPLPVAPRYVSGETHLYRGRQYRLRIRTGPESVRLERPFLRVTTPDKSASHVGELLEQWNREQAHQVFQRRLSAVLERAPKLAEPKPRICIRKMTRRWASCGPTGLITLNVALVKAPTSCIDYVLTHELCHRVEMTHSRKFYALLGRTIPEWEQARHRLNTLVK